MLEKTNNKATKRDPKFFPGEKEILHKKSIKERKFINNNNQNPLNMWADYKMIQKTNIVWYKKVFSWERI